MKSLWEQLQKSDKVYIPISVKDFESALSTMFTNKAIHIPASVVLDMDKNTFSNFIKSRNNYKVYCNIEQYEIIQKRINEK